MISIFISFFLLLGAGFMCLASIGILRFPDLFTRMHSATKAASFGVGLTMLGVVLHFTTLWVTFVTVLIIGFIFLTAPVASHLIARAAYFKNTKMWEGTHIDELKGKYDLNSHKLASKDHKDAAKKKP